MHAVSLAAHARKFAFKKFKFLREYEAEFKNALARESGELFDEKN
jgi:hypothetical protein